MGTNEPTISIKEAREILSDDALGMSDEDIINIIVITLELIAKHAFKRASQSTTEHNIEVWQSKG
jgi:hypothetical protein